MDEKWSSLSNDEQLHVRELFSKFMIKNRLFCLFERVLPRESIQAISLFEIDKDGLLGDEQEKLYRAYLKSNAVDHPIENIRYYWDKCDFSFYFKFIKENQSGLSKKETVALLKNKLDIVPEDVMGALSSLDNKLINEIFFHPRIYC